MGPEKSTELKIKQNIRTPDRHLFLIQVWTHIKQIYANLRTLVLKNKTKIQRKTFVLDLKWNIS